MRDQSHRLYPWSAQNNSIEWSPIRSSTIRSNSKIPSSGHWVSCGFRGMWVCCGHFILSTIVGGLKLYPCSPRNNFFRLTKIIGLSGVQVVLKSYKEFKHFIDWVPCGTSIDRRIALSNFPATVARFVAYKLCKFPHAAVK